jgi:hypothetical protein
MSVSPPEKDVDNVDAFREDSSWNIYYASAQQPMVGSGT